MTVKRADSATRSALHGVMRLPSRLRRLGLAGAWDWLYRNARRVLWGVPRLSRARVTDQLYVGEQFSTRGWEALRAAGITAVVNMREEFDDRELDIDLPTYCRLPTPDWHAPSQAHLREGVAFIREAIARGEKVYVHCMSGMGRAPIMAAAYLVTTGLTPDEALERIRAVRPFIEPNAEQVASLREFAAAHHVTASGGGS
ncbi:MAG: dual specificity protein phosphatase family protein [Anaerolineae bacterium]|nr:dual specificity protein phosphatase family protein [Anaerolineae bacterium]